MLDVSLVDVCKKILDALLVPDVVHHYEANEAGGDKSRYEPLIEFINRLEVHVVGFPFVLVDEIERGMRYKLVEVSMVLLLQNVTSHIRTRSRYCH